jgi:RimJ/RimL family protein N-acetyltransferase
MEAMRTQTLSLRPVQLSDAALLQELFLKSPGYFALIGMEPPGLEDVIRDLHTLEKDPRRRAFLLFLEREAVGYLDYKLHYPRAEEATLSLLLIREDRQGQGLGQRALRHLMENLVGVKRLYAVVYGQNPRAKDFFLKEGFRHVKDGGPAVSWYARTLRAGPDEGLL